MFEVDGRYANRRGEYVVLAVDPPKMSVRYDDGAIVELNIDIQARIWENIAAEREASAARRIARQRSQSGALNNQFFIKSVSIAATDDLSVATLRESATVTGNWIEAINKGDRLIFYAVEPQVFFAVATITGKAMEAKNLIISKAGSESVFLFPIDIDAHTENADLAVALHSVELESQPQFKSLLSHPETYLKINEDDFELLAELLTEVSEEDTDDEEFEDEEEEEDID